MGTSSENKFDIVNHGHHWAKNKTHCKRKHKLVEPNLVLSALRRGYRQCLTCKVTLDEYRYIARRGLGDGFPFDDRFAANYAEIMAGRRTQLDGRNRKGARRWVINREPKPCAYCGELIPSNRKVNAEYCGGRCARKAWQLRQPKVVKPLKPKQLRTVCKLGHRLVRPNLVLARVNLECLACGRASADKSYAKKRGRPFDFQEAANRHYAEIMGSPSEGTLVS